MSEDASRSINLERSRLVKKLSQAAKTRLTLVAAAPGYGKTTAVSQFAKTTQYPVAWHSVEPYERDVARLCSHSLSVLETVCPGINKLKPVGTPQEMAAAAATTSLERPPKTFSSSLHMFQYS